MENKPLNREGRSPVFLVFREGRDQRRLGVLVMVPEAMRLKQGREIEAAGAEGMESPAGSGQNGLRAVWWGPLALRHRGRWQQNAARKAQLLSTHLVFPLILPPLQDFSHAAAFTQPLWLTSS